MKTEAIVASAGVGKRLRSNVRKPYLNLLGKPILIHTLKALSSSREIGKIIVVVNRLDKKRCQDLIKRYNIKKIKKVIVGGEKRSDSVYNGLSILDKDTDIVLIHDGVRPFIDKALIKKSIDCARRFGACVVGMPVKATIKRADSCQLTAVSKSIVKETIDRRNLWEIQTPQVFKKVLILKAYKKFKNLKVTDDAMLVERLGAKVRIVLGSCKNIKITMPEDLAIAKGIAGCALG